MRLAIAVVALTTACASRIQIEDVEFARPIPSDSCLVIGFLGGRDAWDDESKGVRALALKLRADGIITQTFDNRSRNVALQVVREARAARLVVYGQSFGGAAVVKFARQLQELGVSVDATIQVDSVGRGDDVIPPNVRAAANLYQTDGWFLDGEHPVRAEDPEATAILGNWRFDYSKPPGSKISLAGVHWWKLAFRIPHARMDRDPAVWTKVEEVIRTACASGQKNGTVVHNAAPDPKLIKMVFQETNAKAQRRKGAKAQRRRDAETQSLLSVGLHAAVNALLCAFALIRESS